jgi:hypothetical protein
MKKVHHIVLVNFAPQKAGRMAELMADLEKLRKILPGFLSLCGGPYASPEGLNQGFTHGLLMTFADAATRDRYLSHPDHEKIKQSYLPDLEGVVAFDFEVD